AQQHRPDLVLMDISLDGEMDGVEAAARIRQTCRLPVVYLTAYSTSEVIDRAKRTEPFGYILKPYEERELRIVVEMALYRHRMERALRENQRLLAATLRSIGDGVIATDAAGRVTFLNPVAEALTGWTLAEAAGRPLEAVFDIVHEGTDETVASPLRRAMQSKVTVPLANHTSLNRRGRGWVPIDDSAAPILGDGDELLGGVLVFRDVTGRRDAARNNAQLAAIVAGSEDAILSTSPEGVITSWNAAAERLYGYAAAEALGLPLTLLSAPEDGPRVEESMARVRAGSPVPACESIDRRKDGRPVAVIRTLSPLAGEDEEVIGASLISRDVTHLRRLEEQYRQSQKMEAVGRLAGGVAHDFNNLLTVINGYTSVLLGDAPDGPAREMLEQVLRAGERAAGLTQQLLAYSRKQVLRPVVLDLNGLVAAAEKLLRRLIGADIELSVRKGDRVSPIKADPTQIEQVLMNLAVNARDAMPAGGRLTLETGMALLDGGPDIIPGVYAVLTVRDTGVGMDEATRARLFEPFFTTKEVGKGTGLGLATVYGIVKQSAGHVAVESRPGGGTCFRIFLPAADGDPQPAAPAAPRGHPCGAETVLLVEDEPEVRRLTAHVLRHCGYTVVEADGGEQALETLAGMVPAPALLVTDVIMPGMSGPAVAAAARRVHPGLRVLFLSGYPREELGRCGLPEGGADLVQKPYSMSDLAHKVRDVLDRV
ncbi:MAG: response regulator, partial [Gemmataceae bacterium]